MNASRTNIEQWLASQNIYRCGFKACGSRQHRRIVAPGIQWGSVPMPFRETSHSLSCPSEPDAEQIIRYDDDTYHDAYTDKEEIRLLERYAKAVENQRVRDAQGKKPIRKYAKTLDWYEEYRKTSPAMRKYADELNAYTAQETSNAGIREHNERAERHNAAFRKARILSRSGIPISREFMPSGFPGMEQYLLEHADELCHCRLPRSHRPVSSVPAMIGPRRDIVSPLGGWPILRTEGLQLKGCLYGPDVRNSGTSSHAGWDFAAERGQPIYAIADGRVHSIGINNVEGDKGNYGYYICLEVTLRDTDGKEGVYYPFYSHLYKIEGIVIGEWVSAGMLLGFTGRSGNAAGENDDAGDDVEAKDHLHFGFHKTGEKSTNGTLAKTYYRSNGKDNWIDPADIFGSDGPYRHSSYVYA